ncbi:endogenous retrovirus group K member 25 Pro protein-like [Myotis daubentonii]|uniref:endogenous retrovirus group K member 25 Pro protein-like n=1 Tax=Myotis daubentonii TaxID=98922 RepID=UPI002873B56A|nr:endogenous retrovirus group K member 25 Pro protein-like [Myotis daubentonii]
MINLRIEGKMFKGLVDTGADVSVICKEFWPPSWSMVEAMDSIRGVGVPDNTQRSAAVLKWQDEEGQTGWFQPYIVSGIAVNLWGRDVLEGLQACIITGKGRQLVTQMGHQSDQGVKNPGRRGYQPF